VFSGGTPMAIDRIIATNAIDAARHIALQDEVDDDS
jgi:hypothetical protein